MVEIIAAQHFYSSVSAADSPRRRGGYQTLFSTRGLPVEVVKVIEDRAQYGATGSEVGKLQFYPLPAGLYALAHIVPLAERDEFGRKGRYLAHTLVLTSASMQALAFCPLDALRQAPFVTALDAVFAQGDRVSQEAPSVRLQVQPSWRQGARSGLSMWSSMALEALASIAWGESCTAVPSPWVAVMGTEQALWDTLGLLFLLAAPQQRGRLSFDTMADGCAWTDPYAFRLRAFSDLQGTHPPCQVIADRREVLGVPSQSTRTPYGRWMAAEGLPKIRQGYDVATEQTWALQLQDILAGQAASPQSGDVPISRSFLDAFAKTNAEAVTQRWLAKVPQGLSQSVMMALRSSVQSDLTSHLEILVRGVTDQDVDLFLHDEYLAMRRIPDKDDQRVVRAWIRNRSTPRLASLLALWGKDEPAWRSHLSSMEPSEYEYIASNLAQWPESPLPLWTMLVQPHQGLWIRIIARSLPAKEWRKALPMLRDMGTTVLDDLAAVAAQLPAPAIQEILDFLRKNRVHAERLKASLMRSEPPPDVHARPWWKR